VSGVLRWESLKRHAPAWLLSLVLHLGILGPLCLITWAITRPAPPETVLTLGTEDVAGSNPTGGDGLAEDVAGNSPTGGDGLGNNRGMGAIGDNLARQEAPGPKNDAFSLPPPPTVTKAMENSGTGAPLSDQLQGGISGATGDDTARSLIYNLGKGPGIPGRAGVGGMGFGMEGTGTGFQKAVGDLRGKGLDVVLVIDATDSMSPYIEQAKQRLREILDVVTGLVPGTRIGIVAYKDYGDDYGPTAVKWMKITRDPKAVRDFLNDIVAGGGGDEPEPINEALKVATNIKGMEWGPGRKWVIILVGDSSIHPSGRAEAMTLSREFAQKMRGTINVIDVNGNGPDGAPREKPQPDLHNIAAEGGGACFLLRQEQEFWRYVIVSVFGERFKDDVDVILKRYTGKDLKDTGQVKEGKDGK